MWCEPPQCRFTPSINICDFALDVIAKVELSDGCPALSFPLHPLAVRMRARLAAKNNKPRRQRFKGKSNPRVPAIAAPQSAAAEGVFAELTGMLMSARALLPSVPAGHVLDNSTYVPAMASAADYLRCASRLGTRLFQQQGAGRHPALPRPGAASCGRGQLLRGQ